MVRKNILSSTLLLLTTVIAYLFTESPLTQPYTLNALTIVFVFLLSFLLLRRHNVTIIIFLTVINVLLLVGATGWFFSPFVSWLYITAVAVGFLFGIMTQFLFVSILCVFFFPTIGSIDFLLNWFNILSFAATIPLTYFLRKEYLHLKQKEKEILIIEKEHERSKNQIKETLANKIVKFVSELKQPLDDIRQIGVRVQKEQGSKVLERERSIVDLAEKALDLVVHFEHETTGKREVKTK